MSNSVYGLAPLEPVTLTVRLSHLGEDFEPGDVILVPADVAEAFRAAGIAAPAETAP
jgi:hypothetical protein